ncbi:MAG TPA: metallopeptidase family protein [Candidatus Paceibacterota bacterium]|jgi:predicted Zn-dependent protease with MMP-like domain|nr:metallopeptidase family protein [Candidatus Paceibacterota bacterium]HRS47768.1 metallopeptidase family protein [Candidatus Paceibacterota bacterium]
MNHLSPEKFEEIVKEGIAEIPEKFLEKLENVSIIIEDEPTEAQRKKINLRKGLTLFGLYEGVPQIKRVNYSWVLPDKITIFKIPLESAATSEIDLKELVKNTVWHEIAHHFGMDEKEVREAQKRRQNEKINKKPK